MNTPTKVVIAIVVLVAVGLGGYEYAKHSNTTTTTTSSTTSSTSAPTTTGIAICHSSQFTGVFGPSQGAAGTIYSSIVITNQASAPCRLKGWPGLSYMSAAGQTMTSTVTNSGTFFSGMGGVPATPVSFNVAAGATARFSIAWSDVPVGSQTNCPTVAQVGVYLPGASLGVILVPATNGFAPCGAGNATVSPFYP